MFELSVRALHLLVDRIYESNLHDKYFVVGYSYLLSDTYHGAPLHEKLDIEEK